MSMSDLGVPAVTVATYDDYAAAQRAVDHLSDNRFPVENVTIVGTDLRLVERVTGRLTVARSAGYGAIAGAWFGLLVGLVLGIFTDANWFGVILFAVLVGAAWGAVFGAVGHALTGGRRDFASISGLQAGRYAVMVTAPHADEARELLGRMTAG